MSRIDRLLADFAPCESRPIVAAALEILASFVDDASARQTILAPWAWELRTKARQLESEGSRAAAAEAKAIARVISAAALGELPSSDLAEAARALKVDAAQRLVALGVLHVAMRS